VSEDIDFDPKHPSKKDCFLEHYAASDYGKEQYMVHKDVPIARTQSEMTPLQRRFIGYAKQHHEPDPDDFDTPRGV